VSEGVKKANTILSRIRTSEEPLNAIKKEIIIPLYKSLVRLHLDYCKQAWKPYLKEGCEHD